VQFYILFACYFIENHYTSPMSIRTEIEKKIEKKRNEITELEAQINAANSHIEGLQEALKLAPVEPGEAATVELRAGSDMNKVRIILQEAGKPMHMDDIRAKMADKEWTSGKVNGLAGSLSSYARQRKVFTKTASRTFGLIEFDLPKNVSVLDAATA
jgi:chromosome segregation ATPase